MRARPAPPRARAAADARSMPLLRTTLYSQGVTVYLAPTADAREGWIATMQHIALEGRCFVLGCNQFVTAATLPAYVPGAEPRAADVDMEEAGDDEDIDAITETEPGAAVVCNGGSVAFGPLGELLAGPLWGSTGVLTVRIEGVEEQVVRSKLDFDGGVGGHYAR